MFVRTELSHIRPIVQVSFHDLDATRCLPEASGSEQKAEWCGSSVDVRKTGTIINMKTRGSKQGTVQDSEPGMPARLGRHRAANLRSTQ